MKRHTILIPLDGSAFSRQMLPVIERLFSPQAYDLVLLRVAEVPVGITSPGWPAPGTNFLPTFINEHDLERARHPIYPQQEEESARAGLEHELWEEARGLEYAGFTVRVLVRFGDPAEEIVSAAEELLVDMVAMATHSHTGLRQLVMGSVAELVVRNSALPVMLVRPLELARW